MRSSARVTAMVLALVVGVSTVEAIAPPAVAAPSPAVDPRDVPVSAGERPAPRPTVDPAKPAGSFASLESANGGGGSHFDAQRSRLVSASMFAEEYANPDGTHTVRQSAEPLNVQDAAGRWRPVDTGLDQDAGSGRARAKAHPLAPSFAGKADDPALVSVSAGDATASLGLLDAAASTGKTDRNTARYAEVAPDTDLDYEVTPGSVKETILLKKPTTVSSWRFRLNTDGLTPEADKSGAVVLKDAAGTVRMFLPPVEAWDSSGSDTRAPAIAGGTYGLAQEGRAWVLTVMVDPVWLRDATRVFPTATRVTTVVCGLEIARTLGTRIGGVCSMSTTRRCSVRPWSTRACT